MQYFNTGIKRALKFTLLLVIFATSCRGEEEIVFSTSSAVTEPMADEDIYIKGFFLLNEGNMGSNKCTLDYFDYTTGVYTKNIYAERNPDVVKELGDVGNDIEIYRDRLYCVVNCSNFVEVMDLATAKHIDVVSIPNCRYIAFKDDYAYVSSYAGPVVLNDPNDRLGYVAKIDLQTLEVVAECTVGYQPDELVVVGDKLYVANSGGYREPEYDNRVTVIDLEGFTVTKQIEVAVNLHRLEVDNYGHLWVSSRGDYKDAESKLSVIELSTDRVVNELEVAASDMWLDEDLLYIYSTEWSWQSGSDGVGYAIIDTKSQTLIDTNFIKDGTERDITTPYSVAVNPESKEIFTTDAKNYVSPGKLHCYSNDGVLKWSVTTGDTPANIVFTETKLESLNN